MKKIIFTLLSLVCAIIFIFGFAACNSGDNKKNNDKDNGNGNDNKPAETDRYVTYTLDNIVSSVSGMDDYYVDVNDMSQSDRQTYESVISMYGRTVKISKSYIEFVDGSVLSVIGSSEYTLSGNDVLLKNEAMASSFNYVKLKDGVFSLGISQQVGIYTSTVTLNYNSPDAQTGRPEEKPPVLNVGDIFSARIEQDDERALFVIEGSYNAENCSDSQIKTLLAEHYFDIQKNLHAVTGSNEGDWTSYNPEAAEITLENTGNKKFSIAYDITEYLPYYYTAHFGKEYDADKDEDVPKNITLNSRVEEEFVIGHKRYKIISTPGAYDSLHFWGSVGIVIENLISKIDYCQLELYQNKPCMSLELNYVYKYGNQYNAENFFLSALEDFYVDIENDPESDMGWSRVDTPTLENGRVIPYVFEKSDGFHFKIYIDLSKVKPGQEVYFHLSMDGETGINFEYYDKVNFKDCFDINYNGFTIREETPWRCYEFTFDEVFDESDWRCFLVRVRHFVV